MLERTVVQDVSGSNQEQDGSGILHSMLTSMHDVISIIDDSGCYRHVISSRDSHFGRSIDSFKDCRVDEVLPETTAADVVRVVREVIRVGSSESFEYSVDVDGEVRRYCAQITPLTPPNQDCVIWSDQEIPIDPAVDGAPQVVSADIAQFQKMCAVETLAEGIAHDLNNILTAIVGHVGMARESGDNLEEIHQSLDGVDSAVEEAGLLMRTLVTFSGRTNPRCEGIDLVQEIGDFVTEITEILPGSISFDYEVEEQDSICIQGDVVQIRQLIMILVGNALDAMPGGGDLSLYVSGVPDGELGGFAEIIVRDTGHGMSSSVQSRAFDPFFSTKPRGVGRGLGLAIAHGIATSHGGRITMESRVKQGTRATVTIPIQQVMAGRVQVPGNGTDSPPGGSDNKGGDWTMVVSLGQEPLRSVVAAGLKAAGYLVVTTKDLSSVPDSGVTGGEGHRLLVSDFPHDASDVADLRSGDLGKLPPGMPVVLIADAGAGAEEAPAGISILEKPFQVGEFTALIERITAQHPGSPDA